MATEFKPKRKRRNFAEERTRVIQFCKLAIQIYKPLCNEADADTSLHGRIEGYRDVLRQMGEAE